MIFGKLLVIFIIKKMKKILTLFAILLSIGCFGQINLWFNNPIDTGYGLNRVIRFQNVASYNGLDFDMVICIDGYYSSNPSDTSWYDKVKFNGISADFNIKVPYIDSLTRCISLDYKLVLHNTNSCYNTNLTSLIFDLDSSRLRSEYITIENYDSYQMLNPTVLSVIDTNGTQIYSSSNVNKNDLSGAILVNYTNSCSYSIDYCVDAYNNGGNSGFFNNVFIDTSTNLALGDVVLTKFEGYADGCTNHLRWGVSEENNLEKYVLQYSKDGINFLDYADIQPTEKIAPKYYAYRILVYGNENYYRLKIIHIDAFIEYSDVIYIDTTCTSIRSIIYPNPANTFINIISGRPINYIEIYDVTGKKIKKIRLYGKSNVIVDLKELKTTTFFVKIVYKGGIVKIFKLLKYL